MKSYLLKLAAILAIVMAASSCVAGKFMSRYALNFEPHGIDDIERTRHKADSLMPGSTAWYDSLKTIGVLKDTFMLGYNGVKIHSCYVPAKEPAKAQGTAVVVHGYGDNHYVFLYLVRMYRDRMNYNVVFPDLQYHGYSEGDHCQMGWFDRYDVEKWAEMGHNIFKNDFMVLHGVSMGGATVMMASGDELPPYIRAIVEDCGYSQVSTQFYGNLRDKFPMVPGDVILSASIVTKQKHGWSFIEASSVKQLKKATLPMLFIHGDADDFVPLKHFRRNYKAKKQGYKEFWIAPGAVHANSYQKYPYLYEAHVATFLDRVKTQNL